MASDTVLAAVEGQPEHAVVESRPLPRIWPAIALVGLFWICHFALPWVGIPMFIQFLSMLASVGLLLLLFTVWWLTNRRIGGTDRLMIVGAVIGGGAVSALLSEKVNAIAWLLMVLPWVFTSWTVWLLVARKMSAQARQYGLLAVLVLTWAVFPLLRFDGLRGDGETEIRWRWTPTAGELYQAELARRSQEEASLPPLTPASKVLRVQPGDWPGFRGANRDSVVRGVKIATDWKTAPPKLLWRQRVGPGWSSFAVVGDRLFTQEQRGQSEAVVCLDAATGREIWVHEDAASFSDAQAGPGPRATPTFAEGRIYALGATGTLNCLDAATGKREWSRDAVADAGAKLPVWGFASSPLLWKGVVVVSAEGDGQKNLLAYRADSGELAWTADVGKMSYGSPQPASLCGAEQILFLGARGLIAVDPASGKILWEREIPTGPAMPHSLQPHPLGESQVLIACEATGTTSINVKHDGDVWSSSERWNSRALKPTFNDFVIHDGSIYGFDGATFCCADVQTGERRWKEGRYDHGQVLLLADQGLLLVISEKGQVILVAANPEEHKELGRFQAIKGKTWNHPVIAHGRLYVRNAEEMACYELTGSETER